jgi:hypothetical protein
MGHLYMGFVSSQKKEHVLRSRIYQLISVMYIQCVLCEEGAEF